MTDYIALRLRERHANLEEDISAELAKPLPNAMKIRELKKEKLLLRDKLDWVLRASTREQPSL